MRFLSNHSSGKQGYAAGQAALDLGGEVVLITTTSALPPPSGACLVPVDTAAEMLAAVQEACLEADVLIMAAAVADFRPAQVAAQKIKKQTGAPTVELTPES